MAESGPNRVVESGPEALQLERILASTPFRGSEVHRTLLAYLVERSVSGTADALKEYTVALEVFHKPSSYDPRQESTVRMHVARLRQKLAEYYQTEGAGDPLIIALPKGGFKIHFSTRPEPSIPVAAAEAPVVKAVETKWWSSKKIWIAAGATAVIFASVLAILAYRNSNTRTGAQFTELDKLWEPLLAPDRHLIICLSNDPSTPGYSAAGTADGAFLLGQFLATRKKDVLLERSEQLSMANLGMDNMVFVGPVEGNRHLQMLLANLGFVLEKNGVRNLKPRAGEPAVLSDHVADGDFEETYGLVTHLPGLNGEGDSLYLSGNKLSSVVGLVRMFTDPAWARSLTAHLNSSGRLPRYYQGVVKIRSMDGTPIEATYVMHREVDRSTLSNSEQ